MASVEGAAGWQLPSLIRVAPAVQERWQGCVLHLGDSMRLRGGTQPWGPRAVYILIWILKGRIYAQMQTWWLVSFPCTLRSFSFLFTAVAQIRPMIYLNETGLLQYASSLPWGWLDKHSTNWIKLTTSDMGTATPLRENGSVTNHNIMNQPCDASCLGKISKYSNIYQYHNFIILPDNNINITAFADKKPASWCQPWGAMACVGLRSSSQI